MVVPVSIRTRARLSNAVPKRQQFTTTAPTPFLSDMSNCQEVLTTRVVGTSHRTGLRRITWAWQLEQNIASSAASPQRTVRAESKRIGTDHIRVASRSIMIESIVTAHRVIPQNHRFATAAPAKPVISG